MRKPAGALLDETALPPPPVPSAGERWAMFLDVDGTLLEFADDPQAVSASAAMVILLQKLHDALDGALALVSGRTLAELDRLFHCPAWTLAGVHGLEVRLADGACRRFEVAAVDQERMREATRALAARFAGVSVEAKGSAVALHCRRVPGQFTGLLTAANSTATQLPGYEVQPGNLVVEFKPVGMDKGRVVRELLHTEPFVGRQPVYVGDDLTDEHAFACVNDAGGLSVRIGSREPTLAQTTLADPAAVERWLRCVLTEGDAADA